MKTPTEIIEQYRSILAQYDEGAIYATEAIFKMVMLYDEHYDMLVAADEATRANLNDHERSFFKDDE